MTDKKQPGSQGMENNSSSPSEPQSLMQTIVGTRTGQYVIAVAVLYTLAVSVTIAMISLVGPPITVVGWVTLYLGSVIGIAIRMDYTAPQQALVVVVIGGIPALLSTIIVVVTTLFL